MVRKWVNLLKPSNVGNWLVYPYAQAFIFAVFGLAVGETVEVMACKVSEAYIAFVVGV